MIKDVLQKRLGVPNITRWNSMYMAVKDLNSLLEKKRGDAFFDLFAKKPKAYNLTICNTFNILFL
jgi:hypothetical protein